MRYWVYINDKVDGPFDEMKLADVAGFTPDTLICAEEADGAGAQEWVKASSVFEFDEATKTMTRTNMTDEEYKKLTGQNPDLLSEEEPASSQTQNIPLDNGVTQILIEKIDHLTKEIEGMKGKLEEALAAAAAAQEEMTKQNLAAAAAAAAAAASEESASTLPHPTSDPVAEEALITNTASLINHAEQLVAQASTESSPKPIDFLDEIQISETKTESLAEKGGEEVVLRSALDSLYNAKVQSEEEKESTFQDLLSPVTVAAAAAVGTAAVIAANTDDDKTENASAEEKSAEMPAQEPVAEPVLEPIAEPVAEPALEPIAEPAPITEDQREELINEITAPAQQNDFIAQALQEAQNEQAAAPVAEGQAPTLQEITPVAQEQDLSQEKASLDLSDTNHLSIINNEEQASPAPQINISTEELVKDKTESSLTPMGPENADDQNSETTETVKELVPGKKLEDTQAGEDDGILSQADLEEAFTEREPLQEDFPLPEDNPVKEPETKETDSTFTIPNGGYDNPNDMTEVELKEGSTYLISDFIPPAQTNENNPAGSQEEKQSNAADDVMEELTPKSSNAAAAAAGATLSAAALATLTADLPVTKNESVQELSSAKDDADLTMSKVILENTIKTKRGATMDIKTVPMVKEPADSHRLDLSDSELADINAQHDLKAADIKPSSNSLTKMILGTLVALVIAAIIYVMLAYLEVIPAQFNFLKKGPTAEQIQTEQVQMEEMLGQPVAAPAPQDTLDPNQPQVAADGTVPADAAAVAPVNPLDPVLNEVKNYALSNGQTLQQLISTKHPAMQDMIEWNITTAVEPQNYSILVKVPPENAQSFKISYRFNYNALTKTLDPTISDSKNLLDSVTAA